VDILCIQEPYAYKDKVRGFTSSNLRVTQPDCATPWVAVISKEENTQVFRIAVGETEHIMCVHVVTDAEELYIINVYCQFSLPIEPFLDKIERILSKIRGCNVIITMDSNAKLLIWNSKETDERGRIVEEFLIHNELFVAYLPCDIPTYMSTQGISNIDLTIVGGNILAAIHDWKVLNICTTSDHNLILFDYSRPLNKRRDLHRQQNFNIKKANWDKFEQLVETNFNDEVLQKLASLECEKAVQLFNTTLENVCSHSIPKKKSGIRTVPWWNSEIAKLRKEVRSAKKQMVRAQKMGITNSIQDCKNTYRSTRNKYVCRIKKSKKESWRQFVTTEGNKDPWSIVYKIVREKIRTSEIACSLVLPSGHTTMGWRETYCALMEKAVPFDDLEQEDDRHKEIRDQNDKYVNYNTEEPITEQEIDKAKRKLKANKAPGIDMLHNEVLKYLWSKKGVAIYNLLNNCLKEACFPNSWKIAELIFILKDKNKDKSKLGSYRPIALLPTIGKVYERIIVDRIQTCYKDIRLDSERQFGFKQRRSTEDAFLTLRSIFETNRKHVVALFVDIESAFDNIWWPALIARVIKSECSGTLLTIMKSYLNNRKMMVRTKFDKLERRMERGCPQGSILGPTAWNWAMDELLKRFETNFDETELDVIAYADDLAILMKANSRRGIEEIGKRALQELTTWCALYKLRVSATKTTALLIKGKLDKNRLPILKIDTKNITYSSETRYLGLIIDDKMNFIPHARFLKNKVTNFIMSIKRITREKWGIKRHIVGVLYDAVALPIITYGSAGWVDRTTHSTVRRNLLAMQRALLLLLTKACRTTATVSMQVIAGRSPLDLQIIQKGIISRIKRNMHVEWGNYRFHPDEHEQANVSLELDALYRELRSEWQRRWDEETRGRITFEFIKDVGFVNNRRWFKPSRELVYIITGYDPINSSLYRRGAVEDNSCPFCGEEETVDHIIYFCALYDDLRRQDLKINDLQKLEMIECEVNYNKFLHFIKDIFERRNTYLENVDPRS